MNSQNIISLIKKDHRPLKAGIRILKSAKATDALKKKTLSNFLRDLELHAKSEERSLYQNTIEDGRIREPVLEGYEEHGLADLLSRQLQKSGFERNWSDEIAAKAKVLAELVEHHVKEEEGIMLPSLREALSTPTLHELGRLYLEEYSLLKTEMKNAQTLRRERAGRRRADVMQDSDFVAISL